MRQKLLLLCLEGLSRAQAGSFFSNFDLFGSCGKFQPKTLVHRPLASFQSVWAEILWGQPWFDLNVPGYGCPRNSLNDVVPVQEKDIAYPCKLLESTAKSVVVNLPLVTPSDNRVWLSDGSLPIGLVSSPRDIADLPGMKEYRPRPFACTANAAASLPEAITECLRLEDVRLKCAAELLTAVDWDTGIIRLTAFDTLSHLLGAGMLFDCDLVMQPELDKFGQSLSSWMTVVEKRFADARICILSTIGHTACKARVNLNHILWQGGFCGLQDEERKYEPAVLQRRKTASQFFESRIRDPARIEAEQPALGVSPSWMLDLPATLCASVVQGGIFLNLKERYAGGIVDLTKAPGVLKAAREHIVAVLSRELGIVPYIWQSEQIGLHGPDLMVYAEGIEFHNTSSGIAIDQVNKPRSTHTSEGFVWLSPGSDEGSDMLTTLDLHAQLMGAGNG